MSAKEEPGLNNNNGNEGGNAGEDQPVDVKPSDEQINIKVINQANQEVYFKIKKTTPLRKLMDSYCSRQGVSQNSIRFLYDGQRLDQNATPASLGMENNDIIDVALTQTGGSF
ncbi:small ubiquitin-like protein [Tieghemostelium lacteum]|uniref:Small ubiquitin-like protein n=1 Tax=Tieghemostelium lacteum TaxID=361077 RepID=A0A151ZAC3_TIELA|nr:small ubiquitin-like protein [Tieghemostelium lacteum]|eukprot:KYQ90886.1 small ubiquitin-like protein [Tieghemostelium lacteum]